MSRGIRPKSEGAKAADIIRDAGGKVIGRTRLQKIAYFLEIAGLGDGFSFEYRHYGPYSEELATACRNGTLLGYMREDERWTSWGGFYSVFTVDRAEKTSSAQSRHELAEIAAKSDPIELELAATAAFLSLEGSADPWLEARKRKPEKAARGRLENAKSLYSRLRQIETPVALPSI